MSDSLQDVYVKNLPTKFGYPLWTPEPSGNLPESYQNDGLQMGDVGYVDSYGRFKVLFNIRYSSNHELHRKHRVPVDFEPIECDEEVEVDVTPNAIPCERCIISAHVRREQPPSSDERVIYRFLSSAAPGAILILPSGATSHELRDKEEFQKIAVKNAQSWCTFAQRGSLYLITGFHKTRSWSLGSFNGAPHDGEILVKRPNEKDANAQIHTWEPAFSVDWRAGPGSTRDDNLNQTVFITGFKITVRWWLPSPLIDLLPRSSSTWRDLFHVWVNVLLSLWNMLLQRIALQNQEYVPRLSQPFHPSDLINHYLLAKNPNAHVAVTHDRQWMDVLTTENLLYDGTVKQGYVWEVLSDKYVSASENDAVWLERKNADANKLSKVASGPEVTALSSPLDNNTLVAVSEVATKPCSKIEVFSLRTPSIDNPWIVISRIRADDVITGLTHLPVGFYVLLQFSGLRRRTEVRSTLVCETVIEWDDEIILSNDPSSRVRLSFCAAFEIEPILGNGSTLCSADITVGDLVGNTSREHIMACCVLVGTQIMEVINFSSGGRGRCSSLLITAERRYCPGFEAYSGHEKNNQWEMSSAVAHETDIGHDALLRYHEYFREEDLKEAIEHFECALRVCHPDNECRPAALFNLAKAKFYMFEARGGDKTIAKSIALYCEALEMRRSPHPDRPATLLGLGQALLYRYRRHVQDESLADEMEKLVDEVMRTCAEGSHEHRAAILSLQTYRQIRAECHCTLSEIDKSILELDAAVRVSPRDYFDWPHRLQNLGAALRLRFQMEREPGRLDDRNQPIGNREDVLLLVHEHSPNRASHLSHLGESLCSRFNKVGDTEDIERAIAVEEEVVLLTPELHPCRAARIQNLVASLRARFDKLGDIEDLERAIARGEEAVHLTGEDHPQRPEHLQNLGLLFGTRFSQLGDIHDLGQAIARQGEAVLLTPENHPCHVMRLQSLGVFLRTRFRKLGNIKDLEQVILNQEEVVRFTPKDHPDRVQHLQNLAVSLRALFKRLGGIKDLELAILMEEEAVQLTPEDHPDRAQRLRNLAVSLLTRFGELGDISDLDQVIMKEEEAVILTSEDHPHCAVYLNNLGVSLNTRFDKLGDNEDLERATVKQEKAVELTPKNHPHRAAYLNNLGVSLRTRFEKLGNIKDLERAIAKEKEAIKLTPEDHPHRFVYLNSLRVSQYSFRGAWRHQGPRPATANQTCSVSAYSEGKVEVP